MNIKTTVDLFITARRADGRAQATIRDYIRVLDPFIIWCNGRAANELGRDDVRAYVAGLRANGWAAGHVALHVRNLRAFLHWLYSEGYTPANLAMSIKAPRRVNRVESPLTIAEISALLEACEYCSKSGIAPKFAKLCCARDRAIILLLLDSGIRAGELLSLRVSSWQQHHGHSTLSVYSTKTDRPRIAIIGRLTTEAVARYVKALGDTLGSDQLFIGRAGTLGYNGLLKLLRRRAAIAGIDQCRVHPHIFRKTFTTAFLDNGGDPERLRILAGWADYSMLAVYTESSTARLVEAHRRAGPVDHIGL
jgi:site-specific recombinase XerD